MRPLTPRLPGDAPATVPGAATSATNVQEPGVDEPDLVKTDGRRIVTVAGGRLRVIDVASRRQTGALDLRTGPYAVPDPAGLFMRGDRVLVVGRASLPRPRPVPPGGPARAGESAQAGKSAQAGGAERTGEAERAGGSGRTPPEPMPPGAPEPAGRPPGPRLILVDIAGPPRLVSALEADGTYVDARQTGSVVRLVVRSAPAIRFPERSGMTPAQATAANRDTVRHAPLDAWLPHYTIIRGGRTDRVPLPCGRLAHPPSYTGTSVLSVLTADLSGDLSDPAPVGVLAAGDTVYGTAHSLYIADRPGPDMASVSGTPAAARRTTIYRFDLDGARRPRFAASGSVPGEPLGAYALSRSPARHGRPTDNAVHVLARHGDRLDEVGTVGGLGRGERIQAVRFIGPAGYVATFRRTDPLYALDLRDPSHPRVTGRLAIAGYSAYLHPVGDGLLLGVGQDAGGTDAAATLFDVRDPAAPKRIGGVALSRGTAAVEYDPHAFLYVPSRGLAVLPVGGPGGERAVALSVTPAGVREAGALRTPGDAGGIERVFLAGGALWTLCPAGVQVNDATTLARTAWLPFG